MHEVLAEMDRLPNAYATTELAITHEYYFAYNFCKYFVTLFQNVHLMTYGQHMRCDTSEYITNKHN